MEVSQISHFDGVSWKAMDAGCGHFLNTLYVQDKDTVWVGGLSALLRWKRPQ